LRADGRTTNTETPIGIASDLITHVVSADSTLVEETPLLVLTTVAGVGPYLKEYEMRKMIGRREKEGKAE